MLLLDLDIVTSPVKKPGFLGDLPWSDIENKLWPSFNALLAIWNPDRDWSLVASKIPNDLFPKPLSPLQHLGETLVRPSGCWWCERKCLLDLEVGDQSNWEVVPCLVTEPYRAYFIYLCNLICRRMHHAYILQNRICVGTTCNNLYIHVRVYLRIVTVNVKHCISTYLSFNISELSTYAGACTYACLHAKQQGI